MSDEMKLLEALCDALGFDVKRDIDYQPRVESSMRSSDRPDSGRRCVHDQGTFTSYLTDPLVSYTLTPKEPIV